MGTLVAGRVTAVHEDRLAVELLAAISNDQHQEGSSSSRSLAGMKGCIPLMHLSAVRVQSLPSLLPEGSLLKV